MSLRSMSSLVLVASVAVLIGSWFAAANQPNAGMLASSVAVQAAQPDRSEPLTGAALADQTLPAASSPDCPCPGECGAAEHYKQQEH